MKYRDLRRALLARDCVSKPGKGDHEKWYCPCGKHIAVVTCGISVSPGVVADAIKKAELLAEGVVAVTTYNVRARHWAHGWELHIDDIGVTQIRTLDRAERQVRDYLETLLDIDTSDATIVVHPDLDGLEKLVQAAKERSRAAETAQLEAAREVRLVTKKLRDRGLSVSDTAKVMGVSRGRVSQIVKSKRTPRSAAPGR